MEQELISIVVPVYRAERYIEETMDCVRAQTYPHWELLLVEDCGPDRSREIIEQYIQRTGDTRIRMLTYSTNLGAARARNLGVNEAKGRSADSSSPVPHGAMATATRVFMPALVAGSDMAYASSSSSRLSAMSWAVAR